MGVMSGPCPQIYCLCPKRKQQDQRHWGAFAIKTFSLVLVFTPEYEGKICTKGSFCTPKRKSYPKRNQQDQCHWGAFVKKTFFLLFFIFWSSPSNFGQNAYQMRLLCPQARMCPPSKYRTPKESNRTYATGMYF